MERLRDRLGIDRWLLHGGSWGSTLILAYAQQHPRRVSGIVIGAVTMTRRAEIDWCAWEDAVLSGETGGASHPYGDRPAAARLALVRICAHYFSHRAWLDDGALLCDADRD